MIPAFLIPALLGGGLGALTSKKPLQGALLGAGMGAAGGYLAPGLLGGATAAPGASAGLMGPVAGGEVAMGSVVPGLEQYATGFTGEGLLGSAKGLADKAAPYAQLAQQSGLLSQQEQPIVGGPMPAQQVQASTLPQLSAQMNEAAAQEQAAEEQRRKRRQSLLGGY
ncbi:hypothetical protein WG922_21625 [Ramlibacter sp. AN1015]|uniref:hypothetical protein n=1 Tax=Ramlibacter sp. AN1015 TaxID=3133428 RepID=UPI0030C2C95A